MAVSRRASREASAVGGYSAAEGELLLVDAWRGRFFPRGAAGGVHESLNPRG